MKKISLFVAILLVIGLASYVYAENSATAMSGKLYREQQVFVECYNNTGSDISSNYVVIIDTSTSTAASGSTLGAYIATSTTASDNRVLGVTDEVISNGKAGRVCVRGPHKAYLTGLQGAAIGATVATCTTAGAADMPAAAGAFKGGTIGWIMSTTQIDKTDPNYRAGDGTNNYWIWVNKGC